MDAEALQALIDDAPATASGARTVTLPPGTHVLGRHPAYTRAALRVPPGTALDIIAGPDVVLKRAQGVTGGDFALIECNDASLRLLPGPGGTGGVLDGQYAETGEGHNQQIHALHVTGATHLWVDGWTFRNTPDDGIKINGSARGYGVRTAFIRRCTFEDIGRTGLTMHSGVLDLECEDTVFRRVATQAIDAEGDVTGRYALCRVQVVEPANVDICAGLHGSSASVEESYFEGGVLSKALALRLEHVTIDAPGRCLEVRGSAETPRRASIVGGLYRSAGQGGEPWPLYALYASLQVRGATTIAGAGSPGVGVLYGARCVVEGSYLMGPGTAAVWHTSLGRTDMAVSRVARSVIRGYSKALAWNLQYRPGYEHPDGAARAGIVEVTGNRGAGGWTYEHMASAPVIQKIEL